MKTCNESAQVEWKCIRGHRYWQLPDDPEQDCPACGQRGCRRTGRFINPKFVNLRMSEAELPAADLQAVRPELPYRLLVHWIEPMEESA